MIPIIDLKKQYETIKKEVDPVIQEVIYSTRYVLGDEVANLEAGIASYTGAKFAVGVNSGTDALLLALKACGIGPGDEVITTAFSFFATAEVIDLLGGKPVFVDINKEDFTIDVSLIERKINKNTKAIIPVHLYGQAAAMDAILALAGKYHLKVIEDCAQALGAEIETVDGRLQAVGKGSVQGKPAEQKKRRRVGSLGDYGCISFYPTKNLGCFGDGGMIVTNDENAYNLLKKLRSHGEKKKYEHEFAGYNSRLDTLQAAVLLVKLRYLDTWTDRRIEIAKMYDKKLTAVKTPKANNKGLRHVYNLYTILTADREGLQKLLKEKEIGTAIHYPLAMPFQEAFNKYGYKKGDFPIAENASTKVLSIPMYPELTDQQVDQVITAVNSFRR
ncbi:MAG: DegT/DnrJ/EryC1/StrS family aminotransferase [Elusimicrobia bacterium]|nr:DegT/DnrJ/EryC1/StrS family aminotransferase [Elusimicrobiota bacterium]